MILPHKSFLSLALAVLFSAPPVFADNMLASTADNLGISAESLNPLCALAESYVADPVEDIVAIGMIRLMRSPWPFRQDYRGAVYQALETLQ